MKKLIPYYHFCLIALGLFSSALTTAQCPVGYSQATLNWDYLDYLVYTGNYTSGNGYLSSNAIARTQNFAFGAQRLTIAHAYADANSFGENTNHTGEAGSFGTGADINFTGNGTITFTFDIEVQNLRFSIYDVDNSQSAQVTATNAAMVAQNITMTKTNAASALVILGSGTTTATATSLLVGGAGTGSTMASLNISIAGPVRTVTITMGATAGDFWLSEINACSSASFPNNYYYVSQPLTGMPQYVLHAFDRSVYAVNPANGVTRLVFTDVAGAGNVNSMAYDPYNRWLYYVYSLTASPGTNRVLKKYDFNTGAISTILSDISSTVYGTGVGIPVTTYAGVESGAGAFYNGSLFLGVETSNSSRSSGREATIWRVDFDASDVPYRSSQVFAVPVDDGSNLLHDWSDFGINNGMLYDFDGAGVTTQSDIYEYNMLTGATLNFPLPAGFTPGQICTGWDGTMYNLYATTNAPAVTPYIAPYITGTGTIDAANRYNITSTPMYTPANPSLGDASEGFRLLIDFGDAPASYDPVVLTQAAHDTTSALLRIGNNESIETVKRGLTSVEDNFDDGLAYVPILTPNAHYYPYVRVFNNTGSNATLCAWLDYNNNGQFDVSEGITPITVPSSAAYQNFYLFWADVVTPLVAGQFTYMRIRLTAATNGMTASNPTGYFSNGEVEDYRVNVDNFPLPLNLISFTAKKQEGEKVKLDWTVVNDEPGSAYQLERSADAQNWMQVNAQLSNARISRKEYSFIDNSPSTPVSYYRLKTIMPGGAASYSAVQKIIFSSVTEIKLKPNPAKDNVWISVNSFTATTAQVQVTDMIGRVIIDQNALLVPGANSIQVPLAGKARQGMYLVKVKVGEDFYTMKLMIDNN